MSGVAEVNVLTQTHHQGINEEVGVSEWMNGEGCVSEHVTLK